MAHPQLSEPFRALGFPETPQYFIEDGFGFYYARVGKHYEIVAFTTELTGEVTWHNCTSLSEPRIDHSMFNDCTRPKWTDGLDVILTRIESTVRFFEEND